MDPTLDAIYYQTTYSKKTKKLDAEDLKYEIDVNI